MVFSNRQACLLLIFCLLLTVRSVFAGDNEWRPVTAAELQMKTPKVEPDADAEAIFWEVRVDDSSVDGLSLNHYVRVKIFTEKGRDDFAKHDINFLKGTKIKDVEAKITKPDGTTAFLKKDDVLEREIVKTNGFKMKAKSFALPGLEVGSIVEYRYREVIENAEANMRLIFQRELPIQTISYFVKPFSGNNGMYYQSFNVGDTKFEKDKNGFQRATMNNVAAFHEEPYMLPEDEMRSWIYIYYTANENAGKPEAYWKGISKVFYEVSKSSSKTGDEVKKLTADLINGATTDEDKIRRLFDYCRMKIKNLTYTPNPNADELKKAREIKSPGDTLKLGYATAGDIDALFMAMTRVAGFDSRLALSGSRNELFFHPEITNVGLMLKSSNVAIKLGDKWRFFSPAEPFNQYGTLNWGEEGQFALITDSKDLIWTEIPLAESQKSLEKRTGKFKILEDGTLVGEGRVELYGHRGEVQKYINYDDSQSLREERIKNSIKRSILGSAEIENLMIENVTESEKPFTYSFKVRVPNYASRTGKRLFFQPNVFERSSSPTFTANTRKSDIYVSYPWMEQDDITLELPDGFSLENADVPGLTKDPGGIGSDDINIAVTKDGKSLIYKRTFSFGNGGTIRFPAAAYPAVKQLFDAFNKADVHQLTLRQAAPAATGASKQ